VKPLSVWLRVSTQILSLITDNSKLKTVHELDFSQLKKKFVKEFEDHISRNKFEDHSQPIPFLAKDEQLTTNRSKAFARLLLQSKVQPSQTLRKVPLDIYPSAFKAMSDARKRQNVILSRMNKHLRGVSLVQRFKELQKMKGKLK
jgi:elongation factor P--beta-lysine ligase